MDNINLLISKNELTKKQRENIMTTNQRVIGQKRKDVEVTTMQDPWGDAPFYAPPSKTGKESEHVTVLSEGDVICANFFGLRTSKHDIPAKRRKYAVLELEGGEKIRLFTPGQLAGVLKNVASGTYVEITYMGREKVEGYDDPLHQFEVLVDKNMIN